MQYEGRGGGLYRGLAYHETISAWVLACDVMTSQGIPGVRRVLPPNLKKALHGANLVNSPVCPAVRVYGDAAEVGLHIQRTPAAPRRRGTNPVTGVSATISTRQRRRGAAYLLVPRRSPGCGARLQASPAAATAGNQ